MSLPTLLATLRAPIMAAPMFIVSTPALVVAQCRAGIVGSMPALNARTDVQLDAWLGEITSALSADGAMAPFAINQIAHRSNDRLARDTEIIVKHRVPIVIISLSADRDIVDAVHAYGGLVFNDVISDRHARKAIDNGCDGLIAVAAGAGGHTGNVSPFALVEEIRGWWDGPLALSGAIATGRSVLAALAAGADLAYIGTPFIATEEASAVIDYKTMVTGARSADIVTTDYFSGVPANFLAGSIVRAGLDPRALRRDPEHATNVSPSGDSHKTWRDIWGCGHGVGAVTDIVPAGLRVARLISEYQAARVAFGLR
ncbi:MAG: nitronate monooxygenase [Proteobacteria bacterium]|nr:nitronate monooxygenase [Pseudomonadota bacterium]